MSGNCHIQTANCMLIGVPLNDACEIVTGAAVYTTAGVVNLTGEVERQEGTDYSSPNFGGVECGPTQVGETVDKWLNISGEMCLIDWTFQAASSGNPAVLDAEGNTIGFARLAKKQAGGCTATSKPRMALVIVRRAATDDGGCVAAGSTTGATSAVGHFFPNTTDWSWDLPPFEDARALVPFTARGYANPNIGAGPLNLWPATAVPDMVPAEAYHAEVFIDPEALPAINCDEPAEHPAPRLAA